jgi:hypothetical protein
MDLAAWLLLIAFEGIVGGVAVLLTLTYVSFARMERDVRRARMFIMADRIKRFLGAFTLGFLVLAATFATGFLGIVLPSGISIGAFFFFLGTIAYGVAELFFIIRPKRKVGVFSMGSLSRAVRRERAASGERTNEPPVEEVDATR